MTDRMGQIATRQAGAAHPFVIGRDGFRRYVGILSECAQANIAMTEGR